MHYNDNYVVKKTLFGRLYLANQETGDVIDINQITLDILEHIKAKNLTVEELINQLCCEYDAIPSEISSDVMEIIDLLSGYNVIY